MSAAVLFWIVLVVAVLFWAVLPIWRGGALWVPTNIAIVLTMLTLAKAKRGETVIDLGSGDGRIPILAAKEFGAKAVGVELNFFLVWWARIKARLAGAKHTRFIWQDLWACDVSKADVVTLFLYGWSTPKVGEKLLKECKPSVRVVSHLWKLGKGWQLVATDPTRQVLLYKKENELYKDTGRE